MPITFSNKAVTVILQPVEREGWPKALESDEILDCSGALEDEGRTQYRRLPLFRRDGTVVAYTLLDAQDFAFHNRWTWRLHRNGYAMRNVQTDGKVRTLFLHRLINNTPEGFQTDHRNGDCLDNRRCNLRTVTAAENARNRRPHTNKSSVYKGVSWDAHAKKWRAEITVGGVRVYLGLYEHELQAAYAYDDAAARNFGAYAATNNDVLGEAA